MSPCTVTARGRRWIATGGSATFANAPPSVSPSARCAAIGYARVAATNGSSEPSQLSKPASAGGRLGAVGHDPEQERVEARDERILETIFWCYVWALIFTAGYLVYKGWIQ